jgi:phosphoribosylformylglycinamidine cyclo-ligase
VAGLSLDDRAWDDPHAPTVAEELLRPSVIYAPAIGRLAASVELHAVAHITGGGLPGNIVRVLPDDLDVVVDESSWEPPRLFDELRRIGSVDPAEMRKVFNMGIGMVAVVPPNDATKALDVLRAAGHRAAVIGEVTEGSREVRFA